MYSFIRLLHLIPALSAASEFAVRRAAGVVVDVEQPGVALLPFLHSGVPTYLAVPLLEAHGSLETQRLSYRDLTAVGETL